MTTNPAAVLRMLITYAICVPVAILMGYMLTEVGNSPTYSNMFVVGIVVSFILLPVLLKWHYPIMIFALSCPITLFFLKGSPSIGSVMVIISLGMAIVERTANSKSRFISAPSVTGAMIFTVVMALFTANLTGGIGLHTMGSEVGGGKKYIALFIGVATYFALISRKIPKDRRNLYVALFILSGLPAFIGDLSPLLPTPFNYIGLLIRPSSGASQQTWEIGVTRLGTFGATAGVLVNFMLAKYGMRGIFAKGNAWWRLPLFLLMVALTLLGGFRTILLTYLITCCLMFFMEGLHRTRLLPVFLFVGIVGASVLVPFANKLPYTFQRALSVLPLDLDQAAVADAEGSSEWRLRIWRELWPRVPQYLLLGKGYALTTDDFNMIGSDSAFSAEVGMDASQTGLAVAGDYHNGPLSTLIPFGIWGAISIIWITLAGLRIMYRNFKYGDPELRTVNTFLLASYLWHILCFSVVFGGYASDVGGFATSIGLSLALNWGVLGPRSKLNPAPLPQPQPLPEAQPQLA